MSSQTESTLALKLFSSFSSVNWDDVLENTIAHGKISRGSPLQNDEVCDLLRSILFPEEKEQFRSTSELLQISNLIASLRVSMHQLNDPYIRNLVRIFLYFCFEIPEECNHIREKIIQEIVHSSFPSNP